MTYQDDGTGRTDATVPTGSEPNARSSSSLIYTRCQQTGVHTVHDHNVDELVGPTPSTLFNRS